MVRLLSFLLASVLLFVTNIFSPDSPSSLPQSDILVEQMPNDTTLNYDEINSANGVKFYIGRPMEENLSLVYASAFGLSPENDNYIDSQKSYCIFADRQMYFGKTCKNIVIENNTYSQNDRYSTATLPDIKNYRTWLDVYSKII